MPLDLQPQQDPKPAPVLVDARTGRFAVESTLLKVALASVTKPASPQPGQRWRLVYCAGKWPADMPVQITGHPRVGVLPVDYVIDPKIADQFSATLPSGESALEVPTTAPDGSFIPLRIFPPEDLQ